MATTSIFGWAVIVPSIDGKNRHKASSNFLFFPMVVRLNHLVVALVTVVLCIVTSWLYASTVNETKPTASVENVIAHQFTLKLPDAPKKLHSTANLSYKVKGVRYYPSAEIKAFREEGIASYYHDSLHGRKTTSGEPYDKNAFTAAHRTLPIPSYVRVTNPANHKSVIVKINDRGPFHSKRVLDLSHAAATELGFVRKGHTKVIIEQITPEQDDTYMTVKSFDTLSEAQANLETVSAWLKLHNMKQKAIMSQKDGGYTIQVGPFKKNTDFHSMKKNLQDL